MQREQAAKIVAEATGAEPHEASDAALMALINLVLRGAAAERASISAWCVSEAAKAIDRTPEDATVASAQATYVGTMTLVATRLGEGAGLVRVTREDALGAALNAWGAHPESHFARRLKEAADAPEKFYEDAGEWDLPTAVATAVATYFAICGGAIVMREVAT